MPSSFLRRHVRGLLRSKFSPSPSLEDSPEGEYEASTPSNEHQTFLSQCYLAGIDGRRLDFPEVFASYTGPNGGLTQVGEVRRQPLVRIANLDDEMSLSVDGTTDSEREESIDEETDQINSSPIKRNSQINRSEVLLGSCSSLVGPNGNNGTSSGRGAERFNWLNHDEERAFGVSISLYEKNPLTGVNAGEPIADVWGVVGRDNNGVLALADGVNWGEGARLAARCAIRGAIDHLNEHIEQGKLSNTTEVFHELLASFHSAHSLILQEGGMLTTLCVGVVAPTQHGDSWVLCVCNVGDSLCFVYNRNYGVREVTLGSHDIDQMRDMRDAGGALGPVDGRNPQLHNLTCSMTFVEEGDVVFITSDGISDNFDPVVGKFCVIKRTEADNKENSHLPARDSRKLSVATKDSPSREFARPRACAASLPCVDAASRHELMLVRMRDIIANGIDPPKEVPSRVSSLRHEPLFPQVSASLLSHRLIQFVTQLSQSEERARRRAVREKIADMPGKLDHASVVAYSVGRRNERDIKTPSNDVETGCAISGNSYFCISPYLCLNIILLLIIYLDAFGSNVAQNFSVETCIAKVNLENFHRIDKASCCASIPMRHGDRIFVSLNVTLFDQSCSTKPINTYSLNGIVEPHCSLHRNDRPVSPYEQLPVVSARNPIASRGKKHSRGSVARHTLGVDVQWLKKLVGRKEDTSAQTPTTEEGGCESLSTVTSERITLRQRIRVLLGSNRNLHSRSDGRLPDNNGSGKSECYKSRLERPGPSLDKLSRPQGLAIRTSLRE
uniref:PPM-type phosphatase domain-containing protein n=1 Tax=Heterorhabditis bacteriophora TaxID=37862 RepID=A0A1I7XTM3_HETBA